MTFSTKPQLINLAILGSTLYARLRGMERLYWEMNTDLDMAFRAILNLAKHSKAKQEDMPSVLYIITDGQFDQMCRHYNNKFVNDARRMFEDAGYVLPHVVFHNTNGKFSNVPVTKDTTGISLVSGFSPSIMKSILAGEDITPLTQMLEVITSERYAPVVEAVDNILATLE